MLLAMLHQLFRFKIMHIISRLWFIYKLQVTPGAHLLKSVTITSYHHFQPILHVSHIFIELPNSHVLHLRGFLIQLYKCRDIYITHKCLDNSWPTSWPRSSRRYQVKCQNDIQIHVIIQHTTIQLMHYIHAMDQKRQISKNWMAVLQMTGQARLDNLFIRPEDLIQADTTLQRRWHD